ncbi:iron ABC transporter permease [Lysinibacillus sp. MHQ-1]|nr:iron ABC transporter permease [Lysinibacillus sp. MHQ-1]
MGLIIPHIVRLIVGSNYKYVIPVSALLGGIFLVWADALARIIIAPQEMPIGIITAFCGGTIFSFGCSVVTIILSVKEIKFHDIRSKTSIILHLRSANTSRGKCKK